MAFRFRRGFVAAVAATTIASGLSLAPLATQVAHAGNNNVQPPIDACFYQAGFCGDAFMKAPIAPTTVITPTSETDTTATFTFTSPSAGIDTTTPVGCGSLGCIYNHYDWNAYAPFNDFRIISGCGTNQDTCTVQISRGSDSWAPLVASKNDFPTALWLMWVPAVTTGQVSGVVTDGLGTPVPNVTVNITGPNTNATGQTASDGSYLWIVKPGSYVVTVSDANKDVFTPSPASVSISASTPATQDFALATHKLSGTVRVDTCGVTCSRKGLGGIPVHVVGSTTVGTSVDVTATSGSSGAWSQDVPNGSYTVTPKKGEAAFEPEELTPTVAADTNGQDFEVCANALAVLGDKESIAAAKAAPRCPYAVDWTMPSRLTVGDAETWGGQQWGMATSTDVYPKNFEADMFITQGGAKLAKCPADVVWTWKIVGARPKGASKAHLSSTTGCTVKLLTPALGKFTVTLVETTKKGHHKITVLEKKPVEVKDWLIGGVGDSNGSGEGNTPFFFEQCNRSVKSYQFQTALRLEKADPRTSVTFVWASCSGAQVEDLVTRSYVGIRPGKPMPPQLEQLADRDRPLDITRPRRPYDIVLTSIGVNNLSFGGVLGYCGTTALKEFNLDANRMAGEGADQQPTLFTSCMNQHVLPSRDNLGTTTFEASSAASRPTLDSYVRGKLKQLVGEYASYKVGLRKDLEGTQPAHVLMTTYPDFSYDQNNTLCGGTDYTVRSDTFPPWTTSEWGWLSTMGGLLNKAVAATKGADGFTPVNGIGQVFVGHGYCSSDSWIRGFWASKATFNGDGAFHPTAVGHAKAADFNFASMCAILYKNNDCTSDDPS